MVEDNITMMMANILLQTTQTIQTISNVTMINNIDNTNSNNNVITNNNNSNNNSDDKCNVAKQSLFDSTTATVISGQVKETYTALADLFIPTPIKLAKLQLLCRGYCFTCVHHCPPVSHMSTSVHKHLPASTTVHQHPPLSTTVHQCPPPSTFMSTDTSSF